MTSPCRWCESERGIPARDVSYTICLHHQDALRAELEADKQPQGLEIIAGADMASIDPCGHRWDQVWYSACVLAAGIILGAALGAAFCVWRMAQ